MSKTIITAGTTGKHLLDKVLEFLPEATYVDAEVKQFTSKEICCRYQDSIREADVFILQSISTLDDFSCNDSLMELLLLIDAAKGASAQRITAVIPYLGYCRQDKKTKVREPISAKLVANMLETAGVDRVVLMDLHSGQIQGFFSKVADHLTAMPLLTNWVKENYNSDNAVIISPDAGRVKLTQKFSNKVEFNYALLEKSRPKAQEVKTGYVIGDVKGKTAIIVDDMIDTGGTLASSAKALLNEGATEVIALATHGIFSGNAKDTLDNSEISRIVVIDSVPAQKNCPERVIVLSADKLLAQAINAISTGESISEVFDGDNQIF